MKKLLLLLTFLMAVVINSNVFSVHNQGPYFIESITEKTLDALKNQSNVTAEDLEKAINMALMNVSFRDSIPDFRDVFDRVVNKIEETSKNDNAIQEKYKTAIQELKKKYADPKGEPTTWPQLLFSMYNHITSETLNEPEKQSSELNKRDPQGHTPLHDAIIKGQYELVMHYVKQGADVNALTEKSKVSPLDMVLNRLSLSTDSHTKSQYTKIAKYLLSKGAVCSQRFAKECEGIREQLLKEEKERPYAPTELGVPSASGASIATIAAPIQMQEALQKGKEKLTAKEIQEQEERKKQEIEQKRQQAEHYAKIREQQALLKQKPVSSTTASSSAAQELGIPSTSGAGIATISTSPKIFEKLSELKQYGDLGINQFYNLTNFGRSIEYAETTLNSAKVTIQESELTKLINQYITNAQTLIGKQLAQNEFYIQKVPNLPTGSEICVIGDIHGSVQALVKILKDLKCIDKNFNFTNTKPNLYIVFTGDYVDRGFYGSEVWYLLLELKLANWNNVFVLRGNHETPNICEQYGFKQELNAKYKDQAAQLFDKFKELWHYLPQVAFLQYTNKWLAFCHGGIDTIYYKQIQTLLEPQSTNISICKANDPTDEVYADSVNKMQPLQLQEHYHKTNDNKPNFTAFLWSDLRGNSFNPNRGGLVAGGTGYENVPQLLKNLGITALFRGHQHQGHGLKIGASADQSAIPDATPNTPIAAINIATVTPPVFTFTTAFEGGLGAGLSSDVFYGIIKKTGNQWMLIPHLLERRQLEHRQ